jgi:hypothetical protein
MHPRDLRVESFAKYPPRGQALAIANLNLLKRVPLILLSLMLRQIIEYDWGFPAEREQLLLQFKFLGHLDAASFDALMSSFSAIPLSNELIEIDWIDHPQRFSEQLTAYLWSQHQIDNYHRTAQEYQQHLQTAFNPAPPAVPRWTIVVVGRGSQQIERPLFRRLMPRGTLFTQIDPAGALDVLLDAVSLRIQQNPLEYGHWYIDGGEPHPAAAGIPGLTIMSYNRLASVAKQEFALLHQFTNRPNKGGTIGVEAVSSYIAGLSPEDLNLKGTLVDAPLRHFEVNILTQGAGCQIYSTTFVQWASRECLHRAQPLTLFARFATRQSNAPMEQLLVRDPLTQPQDKAGSLIDADMGAYYTWINQSRLAGAEQSRFLAWFEDHRLACVIAPPLPAGKISTAPTTMRRVLDWMA